MNQGEARLRSLKVLRANCIRESTGPEDDDEELNKVKHQLHDLKGDIRKLEQEIEFMSGRDSRSDDFWENSTDEAIEAKPVPNAADWENESSKVKKYQLAVGRADKYKTRLSSKLEVLRKGGWPFDKEQRRTQEQ